MLDTALAASKDKVPGSAAEDCSQVVASVAPTVMRAVLPIACRPPAVTDKTALTTFNRSLECFRLLAAAAPAAVADFLLCALQPDGKIPSQKAGSQRSWGSLALIKHVHAELGADGMP